MKKKNLVVLSGAGISAESGINTFRDANGLWEGHDVMQVASPEGWSKNPKLVLDFYNQRRKQLLEVMPNSAHIALAQLEKEFNVQIITQNVDDLHKRAGSTQVLHLHGQLLKARSTLDQNYIIDWKSDINLGDCCPKNGQLRPHIVWFGEAVPAMEKAIKHIEKVNIVLIIGTSLQVYPAAGLLNYAPNDAKIFYIDPNPAPISNSHFKTNLIKETATKGMPQFIKKLENI